MTTEEGVYLKLTVKKDDYPDGFVDGMRKWAGFALDERCESCGGQFYSRDRSPVCFGCVRGDDYQLSLVRKRFLTVLTRRAM